jgi:hypothetical protein
MRAGLVSAFFIALARWPSGKAEACKAFIPGSNPGLASKRRRGHPAGCPLSFAGQPGRGRRPGHGHGRRLRSHPAARVHLRELWTPPCAKPWPGSPAGSAPRRRHCKTPASSGTPPSFSADAETDPFTTPLIAPARARNCTGASRPHHRARYEAMSWTLATVLAGSRGPQSNFSNGILLFSNLWTPMGHQTPQRGLNDSSEGGLGSQKPSWRPRASEPWRKGSPETRPQAVEKQESVAKVAPGNGRAKEPRSAQGDRSPSPLRASGSPTNPPIHHGRAGAPHPARTFSDPVAREESAIEQRVVLTCTFSNR